MADMLELTSQIVAAHVSRSSVDESQLSALIRAVYIALTEAEKLPEKQKANEPAGPIKRSVFNDHLVCLECGGKSKILKRHLRRDHNLTVEEYRQRFDLPRDYPVVAPDYAEMRSKLAQEIGLGRNASAKRGRKQP